MADPYQGLPAEPSLEPEKKPQPASVPAAITPQTDIIPLDEKGLPAPRSLEEMYRVARLICQSQMVPEEYQAGYKDQPEKVAVQKIMVATFMGRELGLSMMAALRSIAVIKGRPSVWGDAVPALVERTGLIEYVKEYYQGSGDSLKAICEVQRRGWPEPTKGEFSVEQAKIAGLWLRDKTNLSEKKKLSAWYRYPRRMLKMRAREAFKDAVPGALTGLMFAEVAQDLPPVDVTPPAEPPPEAEVVTESPAAGEVSQPAPPEPEQPAIVIDHDDRFPWLSTFLDAASDTAKVGALNDVQLALLKKFILLACEDFALPPEEVQAEALKAFNAFWKNFQNFKAKSEKTGKFDEPKSEKSETSTKPDNFWLTAKNWIYAGGVNFKTVVNKNLSDLYKMPDEFIEQIKDRWYNKINLDLGEFPEKPSQPSETPEVESIDTKFKGTKPTPPLDIPTNLEAIQKRIQWFENYYPDETLDARQATGLHAEAHEIEYEKCRELLLSILMHFQPEPDEQF